MVFITFDGIDGSGKSPLAEALRKALAGQGYDVTVTKEPTDGEIGRLTRRVTKGELKMDMLALQILFAADRAEHIAKFRGIIESKDRVLISDRYYYSSIAYGEAAGADRKYLEVLNSVFPKPDLALILDVDVGIALERIAAKNSSTLFEKKETLERTRTAFRKFSGVTFIDTGRRSKEETAVEVLQLAKALLK